MVVEASPLPTQHGGGSHDEEGLPPRWPHSGQPDPKEPIALPGGGVAVALPYHYTGTFEHDWVTHLGPIYVATLVFVVGALLALRAMTRRT